MNPQINNIFKKAEKKKSKLRLAIFGTAGSGKTYTSLAIASGLGQKIALIDTEKSSASKYADRFSFDTVDLESASIENLIYLIDQAKNYDVLIIDSLSHSWQELLQEVEKSAQTKFKGNSWSAWSEGTPRQKKLINTILNFKGHIIATMRVKTEWTIGQTDKGAIKPQRIGLSPEQGKGIEYEFDMLIELSNEHNAHIIKDRTGKYQDAVLDKLDKKFGLELKEWLNSGIEKKEITPISNLEIKPENKTNFTFDEFVKNKGE